MTTDQEARITNGRWLLIDMKCGWVHVWLHNRVDVEQRIATLYADGHKHINGWAVLHISAAANEPVLERTYFPTIQPMSFIWEKQP